MAMIFTRIVNNFKFPLRSSVSLISLMRSKHGNFFSPLCSRIDDIKVSKLVQERKFTYFSRVLRKTQDQEAFPPLISRIQTARSPEEVFIIVDKYKRIISFEELQKLFSLLQSRTPRHFSEDRMIATSNHPGFLRLCEEIKSKAPMFPPSLLHSAVHFICKHGTESEASKEVMESLRQPLLNLNWQGVTLGLVCVSKAKSSAPFVNTMKSYLRNDLEMKLAEALDSGDNLDWLESFAQTCEWQLSEVVQQKLAALACQRLDQMTSNQAQKIMIGLTKRSEAVTDNHLLLWSAALKRIITHFSSFHPSAVTGICYEWNENVKSKAHSFLTLPEEFCAAAARRAVEEKWPWRFCRTLVQTFVKIGFVDGRFLDYCVDREMDARGPQIVDLKVFCDLNYKPRQFESYLKLFEDTLLADRNVVYSLTRCAVLEYYPLQLIEQYFGDSSKMATLLSKPDKYFREVYCSELLQQAVRVECPGYEGPFPPQELSVIYRKQRAEALSRSPLEQYLIKTAGDCSYIASQLWPKRGFRIAHLLVLDSAGSLVPFNSSPDETHDLESFQIPPDHQKIAVQLYQDRAFLSDGRTLRGFVMLENRVTEQLGFKMVNINMDRFKLLPEEERIPFLMNQIGLTSSSNTPIELNQ